MPDLISQKVKEAIMNSQWEEIDAKGNMCFKPENLKNLLTEMFTAGETSAVKNLAKLTNTDLKVGIFAEYAKSKKLSLND